MIVKQITRRGLLKLLPAVSALPLAPNLDANGKQQGVIAKITPRYFMVFVDVNAFDLNHVLETTIPVPDVEMEFFAVRLALGQTVEDILKVYEISGPQE